MMPQRPEDYMSTKNVGGNRKGGTDAATGNPFGYIKLTPDHAYLGHFKQDQFLKEGHNFIRGRSGYGTPKKRGVNVSMEPGFKTPAGARTARRDEVFAAGRAAAGGRSFFEDRSAVRAARRSVRSARAAQANPTPAPPGATAPAVGGSRLELAKAALATAKETRRQNTQARRAGRRAFRRGK